MFTSFEMIGGKRQLKGLNGAHRARSAGDKDDTWFGIPL